MVALAIFIWQAVNEARGGPSGFASASDPASSVRLWTVLTIRQTILLVVVGLTLLHVRVGRPISFGGKHWVLWAPSLVLAITSTALSGVLSGAGVNSLFYGIIAYTSTITAVTLIAFSCLVATLFIIKHNLNAINEVDPWPPVSKMLEKPRPSFATEDIDALREGGSCISSNSSSDSRRYSVSAWSFSAHHSANQSVTGYGRPVPPLPSPYSQGISSLADPDQFQRDIPRPRLGSQTSWLTSTDGAHTTISAWSYPPTHNAPSLYAPSTRDCVTPSKMLSRSNTSALGSTQVLGDYSFTPSQAEKGVTPGMGSRVMTLDISFTGTVGWFLLILVPYMFSLPYLVMISQNLPCPLFVSIFFTLSVTLSSPILALNVWLKCSFPIPTGLFDASTELFPDLGLPVPATLALPTRSYESKRSMVTSATVIEGRSGDVWISNGDAVDGKGKIGRVIEVLNPCPKLSVIPQEEYVDTSPSPMASPTPENAQVKRKKVESQTGSYYSAVDENFAIASRIMIAQRHYSTLAQTVIIPSTSHERGDVKATGIIPKRAPGHLRSRSIASVSEPSTPTPADNFNFIPTPPPSFPLPPTPPSARQARLALSHENLFSSGFKLNQVDGISEVDALTAGVLPLLVPRLKIGRGIKVANECSTPDSHNKSRVTKSSKRTDVSALEFSSPQMSSTPARKPRNHKRSSHRRNRYSLASLGLGKGGISSITVWSAVARGAIDNKASQHKDSTVPSNLEVGWKDTIFGAETIPDTDPRLLVQEPSEDLNAADFLSPYAEANISHATSNRTLRVDGMDSARLSLAGSAASTVTLFDDIENDFATGPVAESTPHNSVTRKKRTPSQPPPPLPISKYMITHKRSSIVYITSEDSIDKIDNATTDAESTTISAMAATAQGAIKPKASKLQCAISNVSALFTNVKPNASKSGLRPLTLLKDRDFNNSITPIVLNDTRPSSLSKKQVQCREAPEKPDHNLDPDISARSCSSSGKLKPLKLARSEI
ncbi:hypothetical protein NP233_g3197 [Leucocoprinus birnbaumii]|uniref:Uncharacterized protein n=1 Tax=Leucocoprinus birnbaumii TaxID=56174 RepID=A0AAD5VWZ9_9AGAR|nr:hypothetical protein NP233_g3197 [Leucocoprinus birnbaumii]